MRVLLSPNRLRGLVNRICITSAAANKSSHVSSTVEKFTVAALKAKYEKAIPITAVTAYDFPSAKQVTKLGPSENITPF